VDAGGYALGASGAQQLSFEKKLGWLILREPLSARGGCKRNF
jgi:hypothetical protein